MTLSAAEREDILQIISDLSKDAYGFRVRLDYDAMSDEELEQTWNRYNNDFEENMALKEEQKANAWENFNSYINELMITHNIDTATAIRWDMEAEGIEHYDIGYYCYNKGISFSKETEISRMLNATSLVRN